MPAHSSSTSSSRLSFERLRNGGSFDWHRRATTARSSPWLFREVNERIAELISSAEITLGLFICECGNDACADTLELTFAEYAAIRAHSDRFVVLAGHEHPELERVVDENARFLVIERIEGPGEVAARTDPCER